MKLTLMLSLVCMTFSQVSFGSQGHESGGGGGGIKRNGLYLTFGSAHAATLEPRTVSDLPALAFLENAVNKMPLDETSLGTVMNGIRPSGERQYYAVQALDKGQRKKFLQEYEKVLGPQNNKNLVVFAYTTGSETFLLPEFFELQNQKPSEQALIEQAAILFHESLWVANPELPYEAVMKAEVAFQRYLEAKNFEFDEALFSTLSKVLRDPSLILRSAVFADCKNHVSLEGYNPCDGKTDFKLLFGSLDSYVLINPNNYDSHGFGGTISTLSGYDFKLDTHSVNGYELSQIRNHPGVHIFEAIANISSQIYFTLAQFLPDGCGFSVCWEIKRYRHYGHAWTIYSGSITIGKTKSFGFGNGERFAHYAGPGSLVMPEVGEMVVLDQ